MTANLPLPLVTRVGGALEKVISNIEVYTSPEYPLNRQGQMALARMVEDRPALNTEARIALIVHALAWHGVSQRVEFTSLVDEFDIEDVYLALDYLYEVGTRSQAKKIDPNLSEAELAAGKERAKRAQVRGDDQTKPDPFNDMTYVRQVVELIIRLRAAGKEVSAVETLDARIYELGGLSFAVDASDENIWAGRNPDLSTGTDDEDYL
jgi:hypothetical protein